MHPIKYLLSLMALALSLALPTVAQVRSIPAFPTLDDSVTILYNPQEGNGALANTASIYGHFGLIVDSPTSITWTRVQGTWATADARTRMTRRPDGLYQIKVLPRTYFANVPATVTGYRIGMVFRNQAGTVVGRASDGSDIFLDLAQPGVFAARITRPSDDRILITQGATIQLEGHSSSPVTVGDMAFVVNGTQILPNATANDTMVTASFTPAAAGTYRVGLYAANPAGSLSIIRDSITIGVRPGSPRIEEVPAGLHDGPNYISPTSAILVLAAPLKQYVYVLGDFNNWSYDTAYYMRRNAAGDRFWVQINNLTPGREYIYQYSIDGTITVADPLTYKVSDPSDNQISALIYPNLIPYNQRARGIASVLQPGQTAYQFRHPRPGPIDHNKLVIYELHLRDFLGRAQDKSFKGLMDTLSYIKRLGITAVELMPVSEFEGNNSWGYNVSFHGAVDKAYGSADMFKALIDSCHAMGLPVYLDVVYNQAFGSSPLAAMYYDGATNQPAANSPYFNQVATHPFSVGLDFNHKSPYMRAYMDECNRRWLTEFNLDGFRFDLSKGFTQKVTGNDVGAWGQLDTSRVNNLTRIYNVCKGYYPQSELILEHLGDNSEETILSNIGFMLWQNMTGVFETHQIGNNNNGSQLNSIYYLYRGWQNPNNIAFAESHDEERMIRWAYTDGQRNATTGYTARDQSTALQRAKGVAALMLLIPGPKMIWQFGELGYDFSINYCPNGSINNGCRTDPKPVRWDYYQDPARRRLWQTYVDLIRLKKEQPAFQTPTNLTFSFGFNLLDKRVIFAHPTGDVVLMANMTVQATNNNGRFSQIGRWYEYFSGDSLDVTATNQTVGLFPGEVRIYSQRRFAPATPGLMTAAKPITKASLHLAAYPNPTTGTVMLDGPQAHGTVTAINTSGQTVLRQAYAGNGQQLSLKGLPKGLYTLKVSTDKGEGTLRVVVE